MTHQKNPVGVCNTCNHNRTCLLFRVCNDIHFHSKTLQGLVTRVRYEGSESHDMNIFVCAAIWHIVLFFGGFHTTSLPRCPRSDCGEELEDQDGAKVCCVSIWTSAFDLFVLSSAVLPRSFCAQGDTKL